MKLVDGEVAILMRAGKSTEEVEVHAETMKRYNNKRDGGVEGDGTFFVFTNMSVNGALRSCAVHSLRGCYTEGPL